MPVLVVRVRPKTFPFLQLPREIRDVIYVLVLVEPPKYQRRHRATCMFASLSPTCAEKLPFCTEEFPGREDFCHCAKRRHLAILSVNRQVYEAAICVLWEKNAFSFFSTDSVHRWLTSITAAKRSIIRHIAIYCFDTWVPRFGGDERGIIIDGRLLQKLLGCTNLRRLDLGPVGMPDSFVTTLSRELPHLKRDNKTQATKDRTAIWGLLHVDVRIDDVHVEGFSPLDLDFRANSTLWHARAAAVGRQLESLRVGRWEGYCDTRSVAELQLPNEVHPIEVPLAGLPNSPATCARFQLECEEAELLRLKREAREKEIRQAEALRLAREADRRQEAESYAAARVRESEKTEKQQQEEETCQQTQLDRHIRNHLATRKAERKRSRKTK